MSLIKVYILVCLLIVGFVLTHIRVVGIETTAMTPDEQWSKPSTRRQRTHESLGWTMNLRRRTHDCKDWKESTYV